MTFDILITNAKILPLPGRDNIIDPGFIAINSDNISAVGPMTELGKARARAVLNAENHLVMPGLVNTHCHAAMTLFRGLADDLELSTWLNEHIFPAEAQHVNPEMVYWCSKLAAAEMILSGTTMVVDSYFYEHEAARAFQETGLRAVAAQGVIDFPAPGVPDPSKNIDAAAEFIDAWQDDPLITPAVFAHAPYTCSAPTLQRAKELSRARNVPFFIHLAETAQEMSMISDPAGDTPTKHLDALGILDEHTICVHCTHPDEEDLDILAAGGTGISICAQSNLKLACGMAPLAAMLARSIPVGLGTDGCASNNSLDLFREMDVCAKVQKIQKPHAPNPVAVPARKILEIATTGGARLPHPQTSISGLVPGGKADLIFINLKSPHWQPFHNQDLLVYSPGAAEVRTAIINGRVVMRERELLTIDLEETKNKVRELAQSLA